MYYNLDADLHGLNQQSWIFVWRSPHGADDLRISDDVNGRLKQRFEFPSGGTDLGQIVSHKLLNVDGFFEHEFVGGYSTSKLWPAEVPFVVSWNEAQRRYVLAPLLSKNVAFLVRQGKRFFVRPPRIPLAPALRAPVRLAYRSDSTRTADGYPVEMYAVMPARGATGAVLAVAAQTTRHGRVEGSKVPTFAMATFRLQPLISTDDVPTLSCIHSASGPASVKMVPVLGLTRDPFAPNGDNAPNGYQDSTFGNAGASGLDLLTRTAKAAGAPCGLFVITEG